MLPSWHNFLNFILLTFTRQTLALLLSLDSLRHSPYAYNCLMAPLAFSFKLTIHALLEESYEPR